MSLKKLSDNLKELLSGKIERRVFLTAHQQVTTRIFDGGLDAKEAPIGMYTDAYIKTRQKAGHSASKKVILELTGQMRNDFVLTKTNRFLYASGFNNSFNFNKSQWAEETYKKSIFALTDKERKLIDTMFSNEVTRVMNG